MTLSHPISVHGEATRTRVLAVVLDEFLVLQELRALLGYTLSMQSRFARSEVVRADGKSVIDAGYRRSRVLFDLGPYEAMFRQRMLTFLPYVLASLDMRAFPVSSVEVQLTGTNHGEFFRVHTDSDDEASAGRRLTFVYFFHREPRRFGGGELRIFSGSGGGAARDPGGFQIFYPRQNQLVCFASSALHEIFPVICPSKSFADSRFTVNGWLHG